MAYEETPYSIPEPSPWWLRGLAIFMSIMCIGMLAQVVSGLLTPVYLDLMPDEYSDIEPFPNFGFGGLIGTEPAEIIIGTHGHPRLFTASATYRF